MSDPGASPYCGHCAVFLSETEFQLTIDLSPSRCIKWEPAHEMLEGNPLENYRCNIVFKGIKNTLADTGDKHSATGIKCRLYLKVKENSSYKAI